MANQTENGTSQSPKITICRARGLFSSASSAAVVLESARESERESESLSTHVTHALTL
jgi:hypothetical protein